MKVTTQQKALLGVLVAGVVFLAYDQLHAKPSEPQEETEDVVVQASPSSSGNNSAIAEKLSVASRLSQLHFASTTLTDAFATLAPAAPNAAVVSENEFKQKYHLTAVIVGSQGRAMINGSLVRVGQTLDGYRLISVDRASALLKNGNRTVKLTID